MAPSKSPHVYDKAKYHFDSVRQHGLSMRHADNHTVVFLRWLIEKRLMSPFFEVETAPVVAQFRAGSVGIHEVYAACDNCLADDLLAEEGNDFAMDYFDFPGGPYTRDYPLTLMDDDMPTAYDVEYTEENYQLMRAVIDGRYEEWTTPDPPPPPKQPARKWWPF